MNMAKDNVIRQDGTLNAKALFDLIVDAATQTRPDIAEDIRSKAKHLAKCIGCGAPASMSASFGPTCPECFDDYSG